MLDESRRNQLNGIIEKMKTNQEDEAAIRDMVGQFKAKYDVPEPVAQPKPAAAPETHPFLPSRSRMGADANPVLGALATIGDVAGIPTRATAAALTDQKMDDPDAYALKPLVNKFHQLDGAESVPDTRPKDQPMFGNKVSFGDLYRHTDASAFAGGSDAAAEVGGRLASDPFSYAGILAKTLSYIPNMVKGLGRGAGALNRGVGRLSQEMSGVPEDALRAYGNTAQRMRIQANAGKEAEIGGELLSHIDNPDKFIPERQAVDAALKGMGDMPVQPAIDALEGAKGAAIAGRLSPEKAAANTTIDKYIEFLRGGASPDDIAPTVSATEFRKLRQDLDAPIKWDQEGGALANSALQAGRTSMKDALLQRAAESGNPGYAKAMASWSDKLNKLSRIKKILGKTGEARDKRVEGFIDNLFGKQNKYKRELMGDLDAVFQSDILDRAKAAQQAQAIGPDGVATWLPRQMSGRSTLGMAGTVAAGMAGQAVGLGGAAPLAALGTALTASPKIASRFTLPMLTKLEEGIKAAGVAMTPRSASVLAAMKKPISEVQRARLATILAAELEAQMPANAIPFRIKDAAGLDDDSQYTKR